MLYSIQKIKKVFETGQNPVLVECNDLNNYVCKHTRGKIPANQLFAEWICHSLLQSVGVKVPEKEIVLIKDEHALSTTQNNASFFGDVPCFASLYKEEGIEWSQFEFNDTKSISNKLDLLTIAFFDIWMANEDRNFNNFNLLMSPERSGIYILPIDHGACFNSLSWNSNCSPSILTESESIIFTEEFRKIIKSEIKTCLHADRFIKDLYIRLLITELEYDKSVKEMPSNWEISVEYISNNKQHLFNKDWLNVTKTTFLSFLTTSLKLK